jgi:thermitase
MRNWTIGAMATATTLSVLAGCATATGPMPSSVNPVTSSAASATVTAKAIPGEIIVKFRNQTRSGLSGLGLTQKKAIARTGAMVVTSTSRSDTQTILKKLQADPNVVYAELNYVETTLEDAPNDPDYAKQYAPQITQAPKGWTITKGNPNTLIAVVDTGIDYKHPDLAAKLAEGYNVIGSNAQVTDGHGHGTHCAGIVGAITNNGIGMAGIAPNNRIIGVKVLSDEGSGSTADVCNGIIKAADMGAKVISLSLGGSGGQQAKQDAVNYALSKDVVVVAAMGNDGREVKTYPGASEGVIAVGSTDSADKRSSFSNFGPWISVTAPGSKIWSTLPTGGSQMGTAYGFASGTSMATPAVAGLAGLVRSQFPNLNQAQVKARIQATADDMGAAGFDKEFGHGRINVYKALSASR